MTKRTSASPAYATLVAIYQNPSLPLRQRIRAAAAAIGYEKPRLAAVLYTAGVTVTQDELLGELKVVAVIGSSNKGPG
jgi:hypothetical protein